MPNFLGTRNWIYCIFFLFLSATIPSVCIAQTEVLRIDSTLDAPFFHNPGLLYPKWVLKDRKGRLLHAVTKKRIRQADTLALRTPVTSFLMRDAGVNGHNSPDTILSVDSRALRSNDTLFIFCAYQSTLSGEIIKISLTPSSLTAGVLEVFSKKDNILGQRVEFRRLRLNKSTYQKGEVFKAELDFFIEYDLNDIARGPYKQKVFYKGWMLCKVE